MRGMLARNKGAGNGSRLDLPDSPRVQSAHQRAEFYIHERDPPMMHPPSGPQSRRPRTWDEERDLRWQQYQQDEKEHTRGPTRWTSSRMLYGCIFLLVIIALVYLQVVTTVSLRSQLQASKQQYEDVQGRLTLEDDNLKQQAEQTVADLAAARKEKEEATMALEKQLAAVTKQKEHLERERSDLTLELTRTNRAVVNLTSLVEHWKAEADKLAAQVKTRTTELNRAQHEATALEKEMDKVRNVLKAVNGDSSSGTSSGAHSSSSSSSGAHKATHRPPGGKTAKKSTSKARRPPPPKDGPQTFEKATAVGDVDSAAALAEAERLLSVNMVADLAPTEAAVQLPAPLIAGSGAALLAEAAAGADRVLLENSSSATHANAAQHRISAGSASHQQSGLAEQQQQGIHDGAAAISGLSSMQVAAQIEAAHDAARLAGPQASAAHAAGLFAASSHQAWPAAAGGHSADLDAASTMHHDDLNAISTHAATTVAPTVTAGTTRGVATTTTASDMAQSQPHEGASAVSAAAAIRSTQSFLEGVRAELAHEQADLAQELQVEREESAAVAAAAA